MTLTKEKILAWRDVYAQRLGHEVPQLRQAAQEQIELCALALLVIDPPKTPVPEGLAWDRVERRKDNWTLILKEYYPKFDFQYKDHDGNVYSFFGLVHAEDDLYYGLVQRQGTGRPLILATCVGALDSMYEQIPNGGRCDMCNEVLPVGGRTEACDRYRCPLGPSPLPSMNDGEGRK